MNGITVRLADWARDEALLRDIRTRVFIEEQHVPPECEWDGNDARCVHALAVTGDLAVGTGRLAEGGHIGRMAVLPDWRGRGIGTGLLEALLAVARERGDATCRLMAQLSAIGFYECHGFVAHGETFLDAGIVHRNMFLDLGPALESNAR